VQCIKIWGYLKYFQRPRIFNKESEAFQGFLKHHMNPVSDLCSKQEAQLLQRQRTSNTAPSYGTVRHVELFRHRSREWQTDGPSDKRKPHSADRSISIKLKAYTDFQTLNTPAQIRLIKVNRKFSEMTQNNGHYAVQGHSRSPILVPIESPYATSC